MTIDVETEERLLTRLRKGDRKAQRELYDRLSPAAMAVAMRYVGNSDSVRDVLQEAFVKILTSVDGFSYRGEGSLKAWAMRIVSNESLNWLKLQSRFTFEEMPEGEDPPDEEPDVGDVSMEVLQRMIERLPDGYRLVFNLYVFEQKSHREIAALLGIKENSSASQFLRAKRLLAKQICNYKQRRQL